MQFRNIKHIGLRRFVESGDQSGLTAATAAKIANILSFLQVMPSADALKTFPSWQAQQLTGDRAGCWSLTVTPNWRITFSIDEREGVILDLNKE